MRSGTVCFKCPGTFADSSYRRWEFEIPGDFEPVGSWGELYARGYFEFDTLPSATKKIMRFGTAHVSVRLSSAGKLQLWNDSGTPAQIGVDSTLTLGVDTRYRIQLRLRARGSLPDSEEVEVRVKEDTGQESDEETIMGMELSIDFASFPTTIDMGWIDAPGLSANLFFDDVAINSSEPVVLPDGSEAHKSWPGECGGVIWVAPVDGKEDGGTGWARCTTLGHTDVWDALDNLPPLGHVHAADHSTPHQVWCSDNTGTSLLNVYMSSYARAGMVGNYIVGPPFSEIDGYVEVASSSATTRRAMPFWFNGAVDALDLYLGLGGVGSPSGESLMVELCSDSSGDPGDALASGEISYVDLPGTMDWVRISFDGQVLLESYQLYWLVARRSDDGNDSTVYVKWAGTYLNEYGVDNYDMGGIHPQVYDGTWNETADNPYAIRIFNSQGVSPFALWYICLCRSQANIEAAGPIGLWVGSDYNPFVEDRLFEAEGSEGEAGAYPSNWRWNKSGFYDPPLDNSNTALRPLLHILKGDTTDRIALVCALGIYAEYKQPEPG
jgi:hypothetical protein